MAADIMVYPSCLAAVAGGSNLGSPQTREIDVGWCSPPQQEGKKNREDKGHEFTSPEVSQPREPLLVVHCRRKPHARLSHTSGDINPRASPSLDASLCLSSPTHRRS